MGGANDVGAVCAFFFRAAFFLPPFLPFPLLRGCAAEEATWDARGCSSSSSSLSSASLRDENDSRRRLAARGDGSLRIDEAGDSTLLG